MQHENEKGIVCGVEHSDERNEKYIANFELAARICRSFVSKKTGEIDLVWSRENEGCRQLRANQFQIKESYSRK